jgi:hypothetical protein
VVNGDGPLQSLFVAQISIVQLGGVGPFCAMKAAADRWYSVSDTVEKDCVALYTMGWSLFCRRRSRAAGVVPSLKVKNLHTLVTKVAWTS